MTTMKRLLTLLGITTLAAMQPITTYAIADPDTETTISISNKPEDVATTVRIYNMPPTPEHIQNSNQNKNQTQEITPQFNRTTIRTFDLRTSVGVNEIILGSALNSPLSEYAAEIVEYSAKYGIDVYFLCAVMALESGWCVYPAGNYNYYGIMSASGDYVNFTSFEEGLDSFCKLIHTQYLSSNGRFYRGTTVKDVSIFYCGDGVHPNTYWTDSIESLMLEIQDKVLINQSKEG